MRYLQRESKMNKSTTVTEKNLNSSLCLKLLFLYCLTSIRYICFEETIINFRSCFEMTLKFHIYVTELNTNII